jgi:hypothetical protein
MNMTDHTFVCLFGMIISFYHRFPPTHSDLILIPSIIILLIDQEDRKKKKIAAAESTYVTHGEDHGRWLSFRLTPSQSSGVRLSTAARQR